MGPISLSSALGLVPLMVNRCFGVKGKWAVEAINRKGWAVEAVDCVWVVRPWVWSPGSGVGALPDPLITGRGSPGAKFDAD